MTYEEYRLTKNMVIATCQLIKALPLKDFMGHIEAAQLRRNTLDSEPRENPDYFLHRLKRQAEALWEAKEYLEKFTGEKDHAT